MRSNFSHYFYYIIYITADKKQYLFFMCCDSFKPNFKIIYKIKI